jgi:hypothetical protein
MSNKGVDNIQYNSADIGKKPKQELITNIVKQSKVQKYLKPDNIMLAISAILALFAIDILVASIILSLPVSSDSNIIEPPHQQEITRIQDDTGDFSPNTNGQEVDAVIADIDNKITAAESQNDTETAYQLKLLKIDILTKTGTAFMSLNNYIIPMLVDLEASSEPNKFYDLYTRGYIASKYLGDSENALSYLESIIALPDEAFPMTSDDTFREYYKELLENMQ